MSGAETDPKGEFAFFDVTWEDDSQRPNRRVPAELLGRLRRRRARADISWSRIARSRKSPAVRHRRSRASAAPAQRRNNQPPCEDLRTALTISRVRGSLSRRCRTASSAPAKGPQA
jgi:hypothetical protein